MISDKEFMLWMQLDRLQEVRPAGRVEFTPHDVKRLNQFNARFLRRRGQKLKIIRREPISYIGDAQRGAKIGRNENDH